MEIRNLPTIDLIANLIDGKNGREIAHRATERANNGGGWCSVTIEELTAVYGIGKHTAVRLLSAIEFGRRVCSSSPKLYAISSPLDVATYIAGKLDNIYQEQLFILVLNNRHQVIECKRLYIGSINAIVVRTAEIVRHAVLLAGRALIVCHNHPSGDPKPSAEDILMTKQLAKACQLMDIDLLDHVIIGDIEFTYTGPQVKHYSLKEFGHFD